MSCQMVNIEKRKHHLSKILTITCWLIKSTLKVTLTVLIDTIFAKKKVKTIYFCCEIIQRVMTLLFSVYLR